MKHASSVLVTLVLAIGFTFCPCRAQQESLEPLTDNQSPQTIDEVWGNYDPTVEPIEAEVHKEWVEDNTTIRAIRYCIGTFKGQKSWMAGFYAFPQGRESLPAIVQIHGGGGAASKAACIANAKRGYATFSMNWRADDRYLKLEDLPAEAQTDWGAVEGRQVKESRGIEPDNEKRYDSVPSARNGGYFLRTLAARRAITFLQQQSEVDGTNIGIDGHSMGGVITLQTAAIDSRVKAAAPSCAPPLLLDDTLKARTSVEAYAEKMHRPMLFMSPSNDFHGMVEAVEWINSQMPSQDFSIARSVHLNHKHDLASLAAKELWFDSHLKTGFNFPKRPKISVDLETKSNRPEVLIEPDGLMPIDRVEVYYTRDAAENLYATNRTRYWKFAKPIQAGNSYHTTLDIFDLKDPLWVFANVYYRVPGLAANDALTNPSETFVVTTRLKMVGAEQLKLTGLVGKNETSAVIESFGQDWEREWIVSENKWESFKLNDHGAALPNPAKMVVELQSDQANTLNVEVGSCRGAFPIKGGDQPQRIEIYPFDLKEKSTKASLLSWQDLVRPKITLSTKRSVAKPTFKQLSYEEVPVDEFMRLRPFQLGDVEKNDGRTILTFDCADKVVGRIDVANETVKTKKELLESDYKVGLQVHSPSEVSYFLKGDFKTFRAKLVSGYQASVTCEVHVDGKKVFDSGKFGGKMEPKDIEVDIPGAQTMKLVVTEGGNGWGGDWVMWANAFCE